MNIQNSKYFDFLYYIMRREIASNARLDTVRVIKQHSLKVLEPIEVQAPPAKSLKKLNSHLRSKTRNFQQQIGKKYVHHLHTPALFLPKIGQNNETVNFQTQKNGLDSLQEHLHRMLIKNLKKCKENKGIKNLQDQLDKRRLHLKEKEEDKKKQGQKNRLEQLREKLKQLYGELATEQNKLNLQYTIQQKMEKKYNEFYDKMARRFRKNNTVDFGQNTEQNQQIFKSQIKKPENKNKKGKLLSKFRVAAYAAYFISFFPRYYKEFSLIRKKYFVKTVIRQKSIQNSIQKCHDLFQIIKLKTFWKQLETKNRNIPEQTVSAILSQKDQKIKPLQYSFKIQNINSLLQFLLSNILYTVKNGKIDEFIKILANVLTSRSYITDRLFLESQLFDMNVNQQMMMTLSPRQQKNLIVNFLLIKLLAFSFMMNNSFICDKQSDYIFDKEKSNTYESLTFTISKQLILCGIYLIKLCNRLNQQSKLSQVKIQGNIECNKVDRLPLPMPQLQFKSKLNFMNDQSGTASKRISIQNFIQAQKAWENGVHIKNIKNISQLINSFSENLDKQTQLLAAIIEIRDETHKKLMSFKRDIYQQIKNTALDQLSRRKTKPIRQSELAFPIRRQQQIKEINTYCKYFKTKRPEKTLKDVEVANKTQQITQKSHQQSSKASDKSNHLSVQQNFEQK